MQMWDKSWWFFFACHPRTHCLRKIAPPQNRYIGFLVNKQCAPFLKMTPATFQVQCAFFRSQGALQCQGVTKNCAIFMELQKSLLQKSQAFWKKSSILSVLVGVCVLLALSYWWDMCNFYVKLTDYDIDGFQQKIRSKHLSGLPRNKV